LYASPNISQAIKTGGGGGRRDGQDM